MALSNSLWFEHAWLPDGWARDVLVEVLDDGRIGAVRADVAQPNTGVVRLNHALLPAMANLHSHAHQRAMAGLTERRGPTDDSFWTWRAFMYRLLSDIQPHHLEAIAALVYKEMLEAGYATVGEFHYLHHAANGAPFSNPAEMCERIASAAHSTGIGLTLLPVRYASGGIDGRPIQGAQARFATSLDQYQRLMSGHSQRLVISMMTQCSESLRIRYGPFPRMSFEQHWLWGSKGRCIYISQNSRPRSTKL